MAARAKKEEAHRIVVLDKAAGISSAKALGGFKDRFKKVGHAGTLDPFATGVLLVLVGDATRLSNLAMGLKKTYRARVRFGWETDTLDPEGAVVEEVDPGSEPPGLDEAIGSMVGEVEQLPPAYSALKVDGRRAYKLARAGEQPRLEARMVRIDSMERLASAVWPEVDLEVVCGAGTYIRAIARDLGRAVGLPASLVSLRRTAIGPFVADEAGRTHPLLSVVLAAGLKVLDVDREQALRFAAGRDLLLEADAGERWAVRAGAMLVGLGIADGARLKPDAIFSAARRELEQRP